MGIHTHEQWPGNLLARAVLADRLGDRQDMRFVQTRAQRTATMTAGAEANQLRRVVDIRRALGNRPSPMPPHRSIYPPAPACRQVDESPSSTYSLLSPCVRLFWERTTILSNIINSGTRNCYVTGARLWAHAIISATHSRISDENSGKSPWIFHISSGRRASARHPLRLCGNSSLPWLQRPLVYPLSIAYL